MEQVHSTLPLSSSSSFAYSHEWNLIITGFSLGLLHVLAGPDHLSALAALAVGTSYKAFVLGVRWGLGHSTGLIVVAIIFIMLKGDLDLRQLGRYCDSLVGIFMICLGFFGILTALRTYRQKVNKRQDSLAFSVSSTLSSISSSNSTSSLLSVTERNNSSERKKLHSSSVSPSSITTNDSRLREVSHRNHSKGNDSPSFTTTLINDSLTSEQHDSSSLLSDEESLLLLGKDDKDSVVKDHYHSHHHHEHSIEECPQFLSFIDLHDPYTQRILSFGIGILHGVAGNLSSFTRFPFSFHVSSFFIGPGGILGVLPAVEMRKTSSAILYLGSFIFASTLSMGTFASLYGELTKRIGATTESIELGLNIFSSAMSVIVGSIWLILSILGKLDELFH
jgi:ABC-type nickel/cobalt efflux system permease component RcnA